MLDDLNSRLKLVGMQAFQMLLIMILGVTGIIGMVRMKSEFHIATENHAVALASLSGILDDVNQINALMSQVGNPNLPLRLPALTSEITRLEADRSHLWRTYIATGINADETPIAKRGDHAWQIYLSTMLPLLQEPPERTATQDSAYSNFTIVQNSLRQLVSMRLHAIDSGYANANKMFLKFGILDLVLVCGGLGLAGLLSFQDHLKRCRRPATNWPVAGRQGLCEQDQEGDQQGKQTGRLGQCKPQHG